LKDNLTLVKIKTSDIIKFVVFGILFSLFAIWLRFYWLLLGNIILFDIYVSKIINWHYPGKILSKSKIVREIFDWSMAIISALILVIFIRTFIIEAYTIPTPSMERTLMVGDYLFVSKISYGPKLPNTPVAFPFTHNTMPFSNKKSYNEKIQWPYKRLAGFSKIKNNDVVVFNFPEGDTVILQFPDQDYYNLVRKYGRNTIWSQYDVISRPVDKRENFVKRCIGIPGDTLLITHTLIYINNKPFSDPASTQYNYYIRTNGEVLETDLLNELEITETDQLYDPDMESYVFALTRKQASDIRNLSNITKVSLLENTNRNLSYLSFFPYDPAYSWKGCKASLLIHDSIKVPP